MKDKNSLKRNVIFRAYECDAIVEYLEEMAKEGWRLKGYDPYFVFERIEPQVLHYAVEVFEEDYAFELSTDGKELEHCKEGGWEFLCSKEMIYIFVSDKESPAPLQTDLEVKRKHIQKATRKALPLKFSLLILLLATIVNIYNFSEFITKNDFLFLLFISIGRICSAIRETWGYFRWSVKAKKNLKMGLELPRTEYGQIKRNKMLEYLDWIFYFCGLLLFLVMPTISGQRSIILIGGLLLLLICGVIFGVMVGLDRLMGRKRKREETIMIKFLAGFLIVVLSIAGAVHMSTHSDTLEQKMTLNAEQLGIVGEIQESGEDFDKTLFAEKVVGDFWVNKDGEDDQVYYDYTLIKSRFPWVIERCVLSELKKIGNREYELVEEPAWKAKRVYRKANETIETMVVYQNYIFTYESDLILKGQKIKEIIGKLQLQEE